MPFDVLIYATGFRTANLVPPFPIRARGRSLAQAWGGDDYHGDHGEEGSGGGGGGGSLAAGAFPEAYLGMSAGGFPNFFMLYGPNTNTIMGSITFFTECAVGYVVQAVRKAQAMERSAALPVAVTLEVKPAVLSAYTAKLDEWMAGRPERDSCSAWYKNKENRITQNFPGTMTFYWWLTRKFNAADFIVQSVPQGGGAAKA